MDYAEFYSPDLLLLVAAALLLTGIFAGLLAGLLGVGGGIVIVPVLFILFSYMKVPADFIMHMAVATSLMTIIPISLLSARSHHRRGAVNLVILREWGPFILAGAALGGGLSGYLDSLYLQLLFGVIALYVAVTMIRGQARQKPPTSSTTSTADRPHPLTPAGRGSTGGLISSAIGLASALMGIGGGTIAVPVLSFLSLPMHRSVGTAAAFGILIAVPGAIGFWWAGTSVDMRPPYSLGFISVPAAVIIFSTSLFTVPLGSRIAHRLNAALLRRVFGCFLLLSALNILRGVFGL